MVELFIYFLIVNRQYFFKNSNNFQLKGYLFISFCYFSMKYDSLDSSLISAIKHSLTYSLLINYSLDSSLISAIKHSLTYSLLIKKLLVNIFYIYIYIYI